MTLQANPATPQPAKLRVHDFLVLAEAGAFDGYARTELIDGEIWVVNAVHTRHAGAHFRLGAELAIALRSVGEALQGFSAPSTELSERDLPEPDLVVAAPHRAETPLPLSHVRIAIEISDATLDIDLGRKMRLYAGHGVPEYWVGDLDGGVLHRMWSPTPDGYAERDETPFGARVESATVVGLVAETGGLV